MKPPVWIRRPACAINQSINQERVDGSNTTNIVDPETSLIIQSINQSINQERIDGPMKPPVWTGDQPVQSINQSIKQERVDGYNATTSVDPETSLIIQSINQSFKNV